MAASSLLTSNLFLFVCSGLDDWWTHIAFIANGAMQLCAAREDVADYAALLAAGVHSPLNRLVEDWIRAARKGAPFGGLPGPLAGPGSAAAAPAAPAPPAAAGAGAGAGSATGPETVEVEMRD